MNPLIAFLLGALSMGTLMFALFTNEWLWGLTVFLFAIFILVFVDLAIRIKKEAKKID